MFLSVHAFNDKVDRNKLGGVHINPAEVKSRLEKTLRREISWAEWRSLQHRGLVDEYSRNPLAYTDEENWREFRDSARRELDFLRRYREDDIREQAGSITDAYPEHYVDYQATDLPVDPENRTSARGRALGALNHLRADESAPPRAAMHSTLLPRGGVDGTLPQWVYITAVELWMPAEEVASRYRQMQRTMMAEPDPPRTQARALNVARFVWEVEKHHGKRLPWRIMWQRWNKHPLTRPFNNWRDFRTNFVRGADATPPRYVATDEQLTEEVRFNARNGALAFRSWANQVLASTVHQPCINPSK